MKTHLLTLLSIAALLTAISCNEQVSSQVDDAASGGTTGGTTGATTGGTSGGTTGGPIAEDSFKLTVTTSPLAGYKLHRTGFALDSGTGLYSSRKEVPCEVTAAAGTKLSNDDYDAEALAPHDEKNFDITCFLEADELALHLHGIDLKIEAGPNTCDSIGFQPYSYWSYLPGSSTTSYKTISCPSPFITSPAPQADHNGLDCGQYRNQTAGGADAFGVNNIAIPESEGDLCRFNYTKAQGPNCDNGIVTVKQYNYITDPAAPTTLIADPLSPITTRTINCGGKPLNCANGAIKKTLLSGQGSTGIIYTTTLTEGAPLAAAYSFPATVTQGTGYSGSKLYVNHRRDLSNPNIDFVNGSLPRTPAYKNAFNPASYPLLPEDLTYDPALMERYSQNLKLDGTTNYVAAASITNYSDAKFYKSLPFASEPFQSLGNYQVHPFYSFYCYDAARENKARIRLVVREWDRKFSTPIATSSQFDFISDLYLNGLAYQDNYYNDSYAKAYNDFGDWDDYLFMTRTGGGFDPTLTQYAPAFGYFSPLVFPYDLYTGN